MHAESQGSPRRFDPASLLIVLGLHGLLVLGVAWLRPPALPAEPPPETIVMVTVPLKPPPLPDKPVPKPVGKGVKLSPRPSPGVPVAKTIERALTTLPQLITDSEWTKPAVASDTLVNLSAIELPLATVGTGGTGKSGSGAGSSGTGSGSKTDPRPFGECDSAAARPMVATLYRIRPGSIALPQFPRLKPLKTICMAQLDIAPRAFTEGFPGLEGIIEWFALDIRFTVRAPTSGKFEFVLASDDGAILSIDGKDLIDNDGLHGTTRREGSVLLQEGEHDFRVRYFQGPRHGIALVMGWKPPGAKNFEYIPKRLITGPRLPAETGSQSVQVNSVDPAVQPPMPQ